jgi:hypothetical protein
MRSMLRGRRPSPGMIVAVVALSVALAGTGVAGVATISRLDKQEKKQVKKIAKKQAGKEINKRVAVTQASRDPEISLGASADFATILQQTVPAGNYLILGKTVLNNNSAGATRRNCRLSADGDFDRAAVSLDDGAGIDDQRTVSMHLVHTFASTGTITLACEGGANVVMASDRKIQALRVGAITSGEGTGP